MTREKWRELAEERLLATNALLSAGNWASAYYLAGYAVECGLKSCVIDRVSREPELVFIRKMYSADCWTHELAKLMELAGLESTLRADINTNARLGANWLIVQGWNERSRYEMRAQADAESLYNAIADNVNGIMQWIRVRW